MQNFSKSTPDSAATAKSLSIPDDYDDNTDDDDSDNTDDDDDDNNDQVDSDDDQVDSDDDDDGDDEDRDGNNDKNHDSYHDDFIECDTALCLLTSVVPSILEVNCPPHLSLSLLIISLSMSSEAVEDVTI